MKFIHLLATLVFYAGCQEDEGSKATTHLSDHYGVASVVSNGLDLTITSFNAGFLHGIVPLAKERLPQVIHAVNALNTDVVCMQEIWLESDLAAIKAGLSANYPYMSEIAPAQHLSGTQPVCTASQLTDILGDAASRAASDYLKCAIENRGAAQCGLNFGAIDSSNRLCAEALFTQIADYGIKNLASIRERLLGEDPGRYSFAGSSGLLFLSKKPFTQTMDLDFAPDKSAVSRRAALFAKIDQVDRELVVGCTHLASNTSLPYPGEHGAWEGEALIQADAMIEKAGAFSGGLDTVLTGDFNCSFANESLYVLSEMEAVCQKFIDAGYVDATSELECTYCNSNSITEETAVGGNGWLLDRIFVSQGLTSSSAQRVLTATFETEI